MSLLLTSSNTDTPVNQAYVITPSDVLEYAFCPRFIYFMNVLRIPQRQERRFKVQHGRQVHRTRALRSADYLRKGIGCVAKEVEVRIYSESLGLIGVVDEVLTLDDGTMAPLDYKFAEWNGLIHRTYQYQSTLYGMLIEDLYGATVERGFIIYTRSGSAVHEVRISDELRREVCGILQEIRHISQTGNFPPQSQYPRACPDCCYRNICPGQVPV